MSNKQRIVTFLICATLLCFSGCVSKKGVDGDGSKGDGDITIAATSASVMQICAKMDIDLVGIPDTSYEIPDCYKNVAKVGSPMTPDMEILAQVNPDWVLSPVTLMADLKPKYEAAGLSYGFLNLKSVNGMYRSIEDIGNLFGKEKEADALISEYIEFYNNYKANTKGKEAPTVLILMGLPGSYVVATPNSYVGNLLELAGGQNLYDDPVQEFLNINTEDMLKKDPDIILRTAHALPDEVVEMFKEEFRTNDIWKHFSAVKNDRVYDLPSEYFNMSATFGYQEALNVLDDILYE